jgi:transcriptional regulatory protein RtcR
VRNSDLHRSSLSYYLSMKPTVAISLLGPVLDAGDGPNRWSRWRPTVSLCQQDDLVVARLELLYQARYTKLMERIAADVRRVSPETDVRPHLIEMDDAWDFEQVFAALLGFAQGYAFDPDAEDYLVHITTGTHVAQICLFLLTESRRFPARLVQTAPRPRTGGAGSVGIIDLDLSRYDRLASRFAEERRQGASILKSGIATRNDAFNRLIERIEHVALRSPQPLLLLGPTGAGKSQLAQRIYDLKRERRVVTGPFVQVNCATVRGDGAMSALFGHVKGAFTGATHERPGLLRAAHGGVLFLDEIGELGTEEQAMLLRAIEEKRFLPVGADREAASDFQLLAGTNRDLSAQVRAGSFRQDLLARIDLWTFRLPPLTERLEDLPPNLDYELERVARQTGVRSTLSREARERFLRFAASGEAAWTRNFRDLAGAVTRMCTDADGGRVTTAIVDDEIARLRASWRDGDARGRTLDPLLRPDAVARLDLFDRLQLEAVLDAVGRCRTLSEAGRLLFARSRERRTSANDADRLRKYLARFGLTWDAVRAAGAPPG